ncbi:Di-copper centre-containing protein [Hypoxylon trugodes]|uniref:Di-copper centre-containing protein n=1 Tax=Hypoxylon trugodes TaxID=326681 RepID=UPI002192CC1D|nr:Di-copper centre-containing protein [Hypoxylon trugodes]KAI1385121.1 Di-copper centre-containing protein [Hypoxylon trugodes]
MFVSPLFLFSVLHLTLGLSTASIPYERKQEECDVKTRHVSWTDLTSTEKLEYIKGDLCLMSTPAKAGIHGAKTRWDELQYAHIVQVSYVHFVGAFLPFHRYFLTVHEHLLKTECNYTGPIPYWDETSDVGNIKESTIFDVETGFGGNGTGLSGCIADGPFANITLRFREDKTTKEYCISRHLNDRALEGANKDNIDACLAAEKFTDVWSCLEGRPHGAGHGGVSGTMVNLFLSPGDPIFYLHHGFLDKLWWDWQSLNLSMRLNEIGGNNTSSGPGFGPGPGSNFTRNPFGNGSFPLPPGFPPTNGSNPFPFPVLNTTIDRAFTDYFNDNGNITTLNHTLWSANILENITIADVMDVRGGFVCGDYH